MKFIGSIVLGLASAGTQPPTADGHPPALPAQFTAIAGTTAAPYTVYSDATKKLIAKYAHGALGTTFTVLDCVQKLKYTNAGAIPIPGLPPGVCTTSVLSAYAQDCPSLYVPTWPPTAEDFYAGFRLKMDYKGKKKCPIGDALQCDNYMYNMYNDKYEIFDFYVDSKSQMPLYGTIKVGTALYTHSLQEGVNQSYLQRPSSCPDPTGQCAICFTGPCGPCQQCLKIKTGACAKCWAKDNSTGFACLEDDGASLCQKCYKPPAPSPTPPSPAPPTPPGPPRPSPPGPPSPSPPSGCPGGNYSACISLCPSDPQEFKQCMSECHKRCDDGPGPAPSPPSPPAPSPPQPDKCAICVTGACAQCRPCASVQTGPCAPCWAKQSNGSACLPDCQNAGCWKAALIV